MKENFAKFCLTSERKFSSVKGPYVHSVKKSQRINFHSTYISLAPRDLYVYTCTQSPFPDFTRQFCALPPNWTPRLCSTWGPTQWAGAWLISMPVGADTGTDRRQSIVESVVSVVKPCFRFSEKVSFDWPTYQVKLKQVLMWIQGVSKGMGPM